MHGGVFGVLHGLDSDLFVSCFLFSARALLSIAVWFMDCIPFSYCHSVPLTHSFFGFNAYGLQSHYMIYISTSLSSLDIQVRWASCATYSRVQLAVWVADQIPRACLSHRHPIIFNIVACLIRAAGVGSAHFCAQATVLRVGIS